MRTFSISRRLSPLIVFLVLFSSMAGFITVAEVFEKPPMLMYLWSYDVKKGTLVDFSWSSRGDKLAVGINLFSGPLSGKIVILDNSGGTIWDTGDIGSPVAEVSWSPDDEYLAAVLLPDNNVALVNVKEHIIEKLKIKASIIYWSPKENILAVARSDHVSVIDVSGNILWEYKVGRDVFVYSIAWSPDGKYLALATSAGLMVLYRNGSIAWKYDVYKIKEIIWSGEGDMLSILLETDNTKKPCEIVVLDEKGETLWSVNEKVCTDMAWGPDGELLVSGINLTLYDSSGKIIWTRRLVKEGLFAVVPEYKLLWNPDDENITLLYNQNITIIDSDTGETIWSGKLGVSPQGIQWNRNGTRLAVKTISRLIVYEYGLSEDIAVITVSSTGCWYSCLVVFNDGNIAKRYTISPNKTITLYATPGNYTITFGALTVPTKYVVGNFITWLSNKTVRENLIVEAGKKYLVKIPVGELEKTILGDLGKLVVLGPPNTTINVYWGSDNEAKRRFTIPSSREIIIYAVPGEYNIVVQLPNNETRSYNNLKIGPNETKRIEIEAQYGKSSSTMTNTTNNKPREPTTTITSRETFINSTIRATTSIINTNTVLMAILVITVAVLIIIYVIKSRR